MKKSLIGSFIAVGFLTACTGDDSTIESKEAAAELTSILQVVIAQTQAEIGDRPEGEANFVKSETMTTSCEDGGRVSLTMSVDIQESSSESSGSVDFAATFKGCVAQGVSLTGDLKIENQIKLEATGSREGETVVKGRVEAVGEIEGICVYDMKAQMRSGSATASVSGSVCGYKAEESFGSVNLTSW